jgi:hypothetical protein
MGSRQRTGVRLNLAPVRALGWSAARVAREAAETRAGSGHEPHRHYRRRLPRHALLWRYGGQCLIQVEAAVVVD